MAIVDYFLKIDGIEGESTDDTHKKEIDLVSWSWSETNAGSSASNGGLGSGKVDMKDFVFKMQTNKASPKLMLACASGLHIKSAILVCRKSGGSKLEYLKITFSDLLIASYVTGGSKDDVLPVDTIAFNFSKIQFEYTPQKADGTGDSKVASGWDLKLNKAAS